MSQQPGKEGALISGLKSLFRKKSFTGQLLRSIGYIYLVGTIIYGLILGSLEAKEMLQNKKKEYVAYTLSIVKSIRPFLLSGNLSGAEQMLAEFAEYPGVEKICLTNAKGSIQAEVAMQENKIGPTFRYKQINVPKQPAEHTFQRENVLSIWQPVVKVDELVGWVHSSLDVRSVNELKYQIWLKVILAGLSIYLVTILILAFTVQRKILPVSKLAEFNENILENMGGTIKESSQTEEIDRLIGSINRASRMLKKQDTQLRNSALILEEQVQERTKELCLAKEYAEEANDEKSRFLSRMSHELRTPLNAIMGFAQLLEMDAGELTKVQLENVKEIMDASEHLLKMVNDLLDVSRIELGVLEPELTEVAVADVIKNVVTMMKPLADEKGIALKIMNQLDPLARVRADEHHLKQVLYNLVSNAIKFSPVGSEVTVSVSSKNHGRIRVNVQDHGRGIDQKEQEFVFMRFKRLGNTSEVDGAGIGLHLSKQLVELMHGEIGFSSVPGEGSDFWVVLDAV